MKQSSVYVLQDWQSLKRKNRQQMNPTGAPAKPRPVTGAIRFANSMEKSGSALLRLKNDNSAIFLAVNFGENVQFKPTAVTLLLAS
jgi:hypothetical protein